jgi:hypothetical protein
MVSVLVIGPKVCGFKSGKGNGLLRAIKICSTPSFRGEVRPMSQDFTACKKSLASMNNLQGQILIPFAHSFCLLPDDSAGRIAREHWWTNHNFPLLSISFHHGYTFPFHHAQYVYYVKIWLHVLIRQIIRLSIDTMSLAASS